MKPEVSDGTRQFSREYKLEAAMLVRERGMSAAQTARDLDAIKRTKALGCAPARGEDSFDDYYV